MTYRDIEIHAFIDTQEIWEIDDEGNVTEWVEDTDYMGDPLYYAQPEGEHFESSDLDELKQLIDKHLDGGK